MGHFLKFIVVGSIGFVINTIVLVGGVRSGFRPSIAGPVGAELAIISNFFLNNWWTFSDRAITSWSELPYKFAQFNILALSSVVIQFVFLKTGETIFGLAKFKEPFVKMLRLERFYLIRLGLGLPFAGKVLKKFSAYLVFYCFGVGVGLVVNFILYNTFVWRE